MTKMTVNLNFPINFVFDFQNRSVFYQIRIPLNIYSEHETLNVRRNI